MARYSPAAVIYNSDGYEVSIREDAIRDSRLAGLFVAGRNADGYGKILNVDGYGKLVISGGTAGNPNSDVLSIQGVTDGTAINIVDNTIGTLNNGVETSVSGVAVEVLAANSSRKGFIIQNTGAGTVRVGTSGVSATSGIKLISGAVITFYPPYVPTNAIFAIQDGTSSTVLAQEIV